MEKEGKNQSQRVKEATDFVLQWGNRKRLRCCKVKKESKQFDQNNSSNNKSTTDCLSKKKIPSRVVSVEKGSPNRLNKNSDLPMTSRKPSVTSPEKEDRYYTTRGSLGLDDSSKLFIDHLKEEKKPPVWPRLFVTLSNKEKEEDFMAMKGCKPSQRPKKRAKLIQRSILLVSPGAWLSDLCRERYEVREKRTSKKQQQRPRGLKAMGSMESDSE
ncbi:DUF1639 family protein [Citrus sinensis]|uniref:DUF1639 family protein n=3 Tax=Citrus TaxID=2706 RepID=A0ACB8MTY3_CITSI|nr:uncharacterized protein LOC18050442 [Citrus x clementina]XP_006488936.1 uncharacterized protein LOC102621612 isoform X1 [Citrus sinensis]GAY57548.1 hypothetical protein CUMW_180270 [Citrus unshiu]ESR58828.1 hypothetical protein CICLE_v10016677mg [Citrus x clementina]KAH9740549.1 DUF1639 family protein [Citrus sinensis]KAH9789071.1 DUF1639 family protein [Citrus sinensis]KDO54456.1 hypothetical protein CISIN_1g028120mg [Citrus sinensis]